jgi:hypothetical protein
MSQGFIAGRVWFLLQEVAHPVRVVPLVAFRFQAVQLLESVFLVVSSLQVATRLLPVRRWAARLRL